MATVLNSMGVPPAARTPSFTLTARSRRLKLHGMVSIQVFAIPIIGLRRSSSLKPMGLQHGSRRSTIATLGNRVAMEFHLGKRPLYREPLEYLHALSFAPRPGACLRGRDASACCSQPKAPFQPAAWATSISRPACSGSAHSSSGIPAWSNPRWIAWWRRPSDNGVNYFDTAPPYHQSEERLGRALKGRRDKVFLVSKVRDQRARRRGLPDRRQPAQTAD